MNPALGLQTDPTGVSPSSASLAPAATPGSSSQRKGHVTSKPGQPAPSEVPKLGRPVHPSNQSKRLKTAPAPSLSAIPGPMTAVPPSPAWTMPPVSQFPPPFTPGATYPWGPYAGAPYYPQPQFGGPYVAPGGAYAVPHQPFPPSLPTPLNGVAFQPQSGAKTVSLSALQPRPPVLPSAGVLLPAQTAPKAKRARLRAPDYPADQPAQEAHPFPTPHPEVAPATTGTKPISQPAPLPLPPQSTPAAFPIPPSHPTAGEALAKPEPYPEGGQWTWTVSPFHPGQLVPVWQPLQPPQEKPEGKREKRDRKLGLPPWPARPFEYIPRGKYLESMPAWFQEKVKAWKEEKAKVARLRAKIEQHSRRAHRNELGKKRRHKKTEELNAAAVARGEIAPYHPPGLGKCGPKRKPLLSLKQQQEMRERLEKREREERLKKSRRGRKAKPKEAAEKV